MSFIIYSWKSWDEIERAKDVADTSLSLPLTLPFYFSVVQGFWVSSPVKWGWWFMEIVKTPSKMLYLSGHFIKTIFPLLPTENRYDTLFKTWSSLWKPDLQNKHFKVNLFSTFGSLMCSCSSVTKLKMISLPIISIVK